MGQGRRQFTDEFKREAVALLATVVGRCCRSPASRASHPRCCGTGAMGAEGGMWGRRGARSRRRPHIPPRTRRRRFPGFVARTIDLLASNDTNPKTWFKTYYNSDNVAQSDIFRLVKDIRATEGPQDYLDKKGHKADGTSPLLFTGATVNAGGKVGNTNMSVFQYYDEKS